MLTDGAVTGKVTFQNVGGYIGRVIATTDNTQPGKSDPGFEIRPGGGGQGTLDEIFAGGDGLRYLWGADAAFQVIHGD
jgi:hypothetical protein